MRSVYQAIDAVFGLLQQSQQPGSTLPFVIRPGTELHDWQPGDFSVDGQPTQEGVYVYLDKSQFSESDADTNTQSHTPLINFDLYASMTATKSTTTGEITQSEKRADRAIRNMSIEIYEALSHAEFRRLLSENLEPGSGWEPSRVHVTAVEKIGVLRIPASSTCMAVQRIVLQVEVCENHGTAAGVPYVDTDDHITPYRVDDDN